MDMHHRQTNGKETLMNLHAVQLPKLPEHVPVLNELLADGMVLEQKLRTFHWTVNGPRFFELHARFEELYRSAGPLIDDIAERVVALGGRPIGSLEQALGTAALKEVTAPLTARQMVEEVAADFTSLLGTLRGVAAQAGLNGDNATFSLIETHANDLEKSLWMLRAWLA